MDVPHGSPVEGLAGVLRQVDHRLPAVQPLVQERRDRAPVHGIAGGADHRGGDPGARHGLHEREGLPARGRGAEKGGSRSVGVSRGGRNTKVHVVSGSGSMLVRIHLSPGDEHDAAHGCRSMAALGAFVGAHLLMDRAYEGGDSIRLLAESSGLTPVVPPKKNRTDPWDYDRQAYKGRNVVERVFNRMKHHRKAATRYDRLDETFLANLQLILIAIYLKKHSQKPN
ncbi:IS5 family transposase [Bifidobacterium breve]|uniref:IS5 family transposase n=2 Tax=Bifidobacterium breve TaxID=1685 RepID=UPI00117894C9|nr:IS5 family transposase [Bifidobacterium breve]MDU1781828.1 IS5 family transposase [Bifidobacterium breve]MDU2494104.1 IS5 family transposase [Bifidobacterium breve]MDU3101030.1 IS5 family transposase [Bifidobacterium breve]QFV13268.1 IS5 family transposase [Bifidobacterium breve]